MAPGMPTPGRGLPSGLGYGTDPRAAMVEQMLARRTVLVDRELDVSGATFIAAQLMTLDADGDEPMTLLVNSPGGPLDAAATILDTMQLVGGVVDTTCLGQAVGTAAVVVASGTGRRRAGAGARFSLRLPAVELSGPRPGSATRSSTTGACATSSSTGWSTPPAPTGGWWPATSTGAATSPPPRRWPTAWSTRSSPAAAAPAPPPTDAGGVRRGPAPGGLRPMRPATAGRTPAPGRPHPTAYAGRAPDVLRPARRRGRRRRTRRR